MKTLNLQQMEMIEGGKFWGWEQGPTSVNMSDPDCGGGPSTSYTLTHYIVWIADETIAVKLCWEL